MKTNYFIFLFIFATLFFSCGEKKEGIKKTAPPTDIITAIQMKDVLEDVFLAEGATGVAELKQHNVKYQSLHYYTFVLKKHNMSSRQFMANFNYYANDVDQMEKILTDVINDLTEKQNITKKN